ncbi:MAG: single-stranded-DNA-specific exonuclease RecJ [bacterium]
MKWNIKKSTNRKEYQHLISSLNIPPIIANLLVHRHLNNEEQIKTFFECQWADTHDPYLLKDMEKAVQRIITALQNNEKIFIYGDYDVDGVTSVSLLKIFLDQLGADVHYYIPDRLKEGYGLSEQGIQNAVDINARLLITVDCGIKGVQEIKQAREKGIDSIICDHHEQDKTLPPATAILNPKQKKCPYPFKELAGVGVAFKLIQGINKYLKVEEEKSKQFLDLVALGTAADIVPLIGENRIFVKEGMGRINQTDRVGIRSLIETIGLTGKKIGTGQIVFILAPRINAAGRVGNAERAVKLLTTDNQQQADNLAKILESENRIRKDIDEQTLNEALIMLESAFDIQQDRVIVLAKEGWHPGVIGIVASRISEKINRPVIMIAIEESIGKGSARSIKNFDLYSALTLCKDSLIRYGGHKYAAGLTIDQDKINSFRQQLNAVSADMITEEDLVKTITVDMEISLSDINDELVKYLKLFEPHGPKNMRPVFISRNLEVVGTPRIVGRNHLKFKVRENNKIFDAIGFNLGELIYRLCPGENNLDMVYIIEENHWNGRTQTQLRVKDIK